MPKAPPPDDPISKAIAELEALGVTHLSEMPADARQAAQRVRKASDDPSFDPSKVTVIHITGGEDVGDRVRVRDLIQNKMHLIEELMASPPVRTVLDADAPKEAPPDA